MRNILYLIIILISCFSCTNLNSRKTIISGLLPEHANKEVVFINDTNNTRTTLDSTGYFFFSTKIAKPGIYNLKTGKKYSVFAEPGDKIIISKVGAEVQFSGNNAEINNYLIKWNQFYSSVDTMRFNDYYSLSPKEFMSYTQEVLDKLLSNLQQLEVENVSIHDEFVYLEENRIKYLIYADRNFYENFMTNEVPEYLHAEFYSYLKETELNNVELIGLKEYVSFLQSYVRLMQQKSIKQFPSIGYDPAYQTKILFDIIEDKFTDQRFIDVILPAMMDLSIMQFQVNDELMKRFYTKLCKSEKMKTSFKRFYEATKSVFPGVIAPDFSLYDDTGKRYTISDFKGKYLLIDVWETICSPCIRELPYLKEVEKEFKNRDIVFLSVCLDKSKEKWLNKKNELEMHGIQLIAENGWKSNFADDYFIRVTPRYILIDRKGIIKYPDMPMPSQGLGDVLKGINDL